MDEGEGDEETLLLSPGQRHEPRVALGFETELGDERVRVSDVGAIKGTPEVDRFPHFDPLLELRLLMLHADALSKRVGIATRIEAEHGDLPLVGNAIAFDAFHRCRFAGAVRTYASEDLALVHLERHVVDGDRAPVTLTKLAHDDARVHPASDKRGLRGVF